MCITINPKDTNTFASACVDGTVKVWSLGSSVANFTLDGHEKGVNWVDYYYGGEKPYMITAGDDSYVYIIINQYYAKCHYSRIMDHN